MQLTQKIQTNTRDAAMAKSADAWGRGGHIFTAFRLQTGLALENSFTGQEATLEDDGRTFARVKEERGG